MGQTIHYTIPVYPLLMGSDAVPQRTHEEMLARAQQLATQVLTGLEFPHAVRYVDLRRSQHPEPNQFTYGLQVTLQGPGAKCEELSFGWSRDHAGANLTGSQHCKTQNAQEPRRTHRAVVQVIQAWDQAGLIQSVHDEANTYRRPGNATKPQQPGQQLPLDLAPATPAASPATPPPATVTQPEPPAPEAHPDTPEVQEHTDPAGAPQGPVPAGRENHGSTQASQADLPQRASLTTLALRRKLRANWRRSGREKPVLKIFNPAGAATWIIHSMDPSDNDTLFGLCDLGMGFPELGHVSLSELEQVRPTVRLIVRGRTLEAPTLLERDRYFHPTHSLMAYAHAARAQAAITENTQHLDQAAIRYPAAARA